MLIGISPCISPDLLLALDRMGHGDEIILTDAFFPADTYAKRVIRADGIGVAVLLDGILRLMNIDDFVADPVTMMEPVPGDRADPKVEASYRAVIDRRWPKTPAIRRIDRFAFYERAKQAYAVVVTGELVKYGNIIVKKGVIPVAVGD